MAHQTIADFRGGLDVRKGIRAGTPGTFFDGLNVHINSGGQIENRLALVPWAVVPANSYGLAASATKLYVFGPTASPALPSNMIYQAMTHPSAHALVRIRDADMFQGKPYVLAEFANGDVLHFYDGASVTAWAPAGTLYGQKAVACVTLGEKVYAIAGNTLHFCEVGDPTKWGTATNGAGNIDLSTNLGGSESLTGIAVYIDRLAVFSGTAAQIWSVDPDPDKNFLVQTIPNMGALAAMATIPYGESDVFVLTRSGVRSLRVREMSQTNLATTYDIGAPIDDLIRAAVRGMADVTRACAAVEPLWSRYLIALGQTVYAFSYFPASKVSAWSPYDFGGAVDAFAVLGNQLYVRIGAGVYLLGGENGATYDTSPYEAVLPFMDGQSPYTIKALDGIDVGCQGRWDIDAGANPKRPDERVNIANIQDSTWGDGRIPVGINGTHVGLRFHGRSPQKAVLESVVLHYTPFDDKDNGA
jgi:hypothetical protein